ncbi:copper resistance CopC/CopD family protein [Chelatococcus asaccharovorans]|uniref:copper resistance CopC/CopD family protein n=1 Tax=Chelatococcus asaccharovorans TaxID=28210 RepID=UPI00224C7757|nr:CopD family protein [Chelatococcus asaccharovorans]CAH1655512.1 Copper transport protein [Chelatococcus asaccharovorans]CAH1685401.1 Copper transport protein [Chelatococcus asaccharovorans]
MIQRTRALFFLWLAMLMGAATCLLALTGDAAAHAALVRVEPADGAVIGTAPNSFSLTFSEPTSPLVLKLIKPDGTITTLDRFVLRDTTLDIAAPTGLGNGTHVLSWRIVSEDGHPVGGSAVFSIGAPSSGSPPSVSDAIDWPVRIAIWACKVVLYAGLFIGIGGIFFTQWIGGPSPAALRVAVGAAGAALLVTPLTVGLQGLDALGTPLSALGNAVAWTTGFSTSYGNTAIVAAMSAAVALVALLAGGWIGKVLSLLALVGVGVALAASGHAGAAQPQWVTRPAVFLHAIGITFWAGSLIPLAAALRMQSPDAILALRRFSKVIPVAVLPLVAAGILLAIIQLGSPSALWSTAYGQVLIAKLVLLVALFGLAAFNRFWLTAPAERGERPATAQLVRSIRLELAIVLAIFAVAAFWRFTPPPRALAAAAAAPASVHIHSAKAMADLTITPGRVGPASASIVVMTGDFGPLDAKAVTLILANPSAGIEPIRRPATRLGDGTWQVDALNLPLPGRWAARIDILVSDFELAKLESPIDIRP